MKPPPTGINELIPNSPPKENKAPLIAGFVVFGGFAKLCFGKGRETTKE